MKALRIGTRGSALALWQATSIAESLRRNGGVETELIIIKTSGDKFQQTSFSEMGTKGVFIKELEDALFDERVDLAVHSMKDLPTEMPDGLTIAAICKREDVRDALLSVPGASLETLPKNARVGTSSLRRQSQLLHARSDLRMLEIRGNVDTRIEKLKRGDYDAIVLAKAGLDRLGLSGHISQVLPHEVSLPAAGQGAIGIEARAEDIETLRVLASLNDAETRGAVSAERAALAALEGGCQVSIGAWGRIENGALVLDVAVLSPDGKQRMWEKSSGAPDEAEAIGQRVAHKLRERGAATLLAREKPRDTRMNTFSKPLEGKRIVVTRAIEQARGLKERLEKVGATVLLLPAVSFSEPEDSTALDAAIQSLENFHWVLFTSANAVRFFAARCHKLGCAFGKGQRPRCAAVGPMTASAAAAEGFVIDYVAQEFLGIALARELRASLGGKRVLLPRSERAGRELPDALKAGGAQVTEVVAYHTGGVGASEPGVMEALREARVDVVSFFSPSAVENIRGELGVDVFSRLASKAAMAVVGPVTAAALRDAGVPVAIEATEATAESMAVAIEKYFSVRAPFQTRSA